MSDQITPLGVPQDYAELFDLYNSLIEAKASSIKTSSRDVLDKLKDLRTIETFDFTQEAPGYFTRSEVLQYLGLTSSQWGLILKSTRRPTKTEHTPRWKQNPLKVNNGGGYASRKDLPETLYWSQDIIDMRESLGRHLTLVRPKCPNITKAFIAHLERCLDQILESPTDLSDIPQDNLEMQAMYGDYVITQVRRISKIRTEEELRDVVQHIWTEILNSDVLGKFVQSAKTKLPRTLTLQESLDYLGITETQWVEAKAYRVKRNIWMPKPVRRTQLGDLYLTTDIQALDEQGFLKSQRTNVSRRPELSPRGFKSYLGMAVSNHFKNLLRTRSRRHKERCLGETTTLVPSSSGGYRKVQCEEPCVWEDALASLQHTDMESMLDLVSELKRHNIDPRTQSGFAVLDRMSKRNVTMGMALVGSAGRV